MGVSPRGTNAYSNSPRGRLRCSRAVSLGREAAGAAFGGGGKVPREEGVTKNERRMRARARGTCAAIVLASQTNERRSFVSWRGGRTVGVARGSIDPLASRDRWRICPLQNIAIIDSLHDKRQEVILKNGTYKSRRCQKVQPTRRNFL